MHDEMYDEMDVGKLSREVKKLDGEMGEINKTPRARPAMSGYADTATRNRAPEFKNVNLKGV